ncbi:sigma-54-dependent Fis family transcriptional regulator, partial [Pseudomonas aeruginosa]
HLATVLAQQTLGKRQDVRRAFAQRPPGQREDRQAIVEVLAETPRRDFRREDLYYRLSVFPLAWRPLRERPADILPLAERLLRKHSRKMNLGAVALGPEAAQCLVRHAWPGNVRELDNAIQRALILQQGGLIQPADLCLTAPIGMPLAAPVPMPARPPATPPSVEIPAPAEGQD